MERYTRLYSLPENLYTQGSPVIIAAGALLLDNQTGKVMAQLKLRSVSLQEIKAAMMSVEAFDVMHAPLEGVASHQYLDLNAKRDGEFGQKQAITLPDGNTRSFAPHCTRVVFSDDTTWEAPENAVWDSLPKPTPLSDRLSYELAEQYKRDTTEKAAYVPESFSGLWRCTCGALNQEAEQTCHTCRLSRKAQTDALNEKTLREHLTAYKAAEAEKAAAEAEQKAKEAAALAAKQKKAKKITVIVAATVCVCIAALLVVTKVIVSTSKYNAAVALMDAGQTVEAYESLIALDGYKDSAEKAASIYESYKLYMAEVGDYVYFGSYEQDNDTSNGQEDIEWLVLAKEDNKILVISKYALDCQPYNTARKKVTWETCVLRNWLNSDFISAAFTEDEKALILETTVTADKNPSYSTDPGNDTTDKIFLLSIDEANEYFSSDDERMCAPAAYAKAQGAYSSSDYEVDGEATCWWWLRSPGYLQDYAAVVYFGGGVYYYGLNVYFDYACVRPAFWINLDS